MHFQTTTAGPLKLYNSGFSRSRITLVAPAQGPAGQPYQVAGTRWLVFGRDTARQFHNLIAGYSWPKLDELLAGVGGFSSYTWSKMVHNWALEEGESRTAAGCRFMNFGRGNTRVLLVGPVPAKGIQPDRIDETSIIALSPAARRCFAEYLESLPGANVAASAAAAETIPGGLGGESLVRARRALAGQG